MDKKYIDVFGVIDPFLRKNYIQKRVVRDKDITTVLGVGFIEFAVEICDWFNLFDSEKDKNEFINLYNG